MTLVIGIDTGGTFTDAVLMETASGSVLKKSKSATTKDDLSLCITNALEKVIPVETKFVEKVVLSTTLATNAIIEGHWDDVGLILIGKDTGSIGIEKNREVLSGRFNIKGRELVPLDMPEVEGSVKKAISNVKAIAISGLMSTRNPEHEMAVKKVVLEYSDLPVVCGHELVSELGFSQRTQTVLINASLIPIIQKFIDAVRNVMIKKNIDAPLYIIRGDGSLVDSYYIEEKPVDTILSGPAASVVGAMHLVQNEDAIVIDMGGTTTDYALFKDRKVNISKKGVSIGDWNPRVRSLELQTLGLGGDSKIDIVNNNIIIGPNRILPACRGGTGVTPTDILHYTGEFLEWDASSAKNMIDKIVDGTDFSSENFVDSVINIILEKLKYMYLEAACGETIPIIALGAPAGAWLMKLSQKYGFEVLLPENYEVANAVGVAASEFQEELTAIIRPGEKGIGFLVHTPQTRKFFDEYKDAKQYAIIQTKEEILLLLQTEGAQFIEVDVDEEEEYLSNQNNKKIFIEAKITTRLKKSYLP